MKRIVTDETPFAEGMRSCETSMQAELGHPLRTQGCIVLFCLAGSAVVECNFSRIPFRRGSVAVIFSDTLFSVMKASRGFKACRCELSVPLSDEVTYLSSHSFFEWVSDNPVIHMSGQRTIETGLWLSMLDWIEREGSHEHRGDMLRNHWQNLFLAFESGLRPMLESRDVGTLSGPRRIFHRFCQLLGENCREHHDVRFYADRLCITPYYLSRITSRIFGVSPKELIDRQIVMEIKTLLTTTDLTVTEIAHRYNFETASYLGRYFRRHTSVTPKEFRRLHG